MVFGSQKGDLLKLSFEIFKLVISLFYQLQLSFERSNRLLSARFPDEPL